MCSKFNKSHFSENKYVKEMLIKPNFYIYFIYIYILQYRGLQEALQTASLLV